MGSISSEQTEMLRSPIFYLWMLVIVATLGLSVFGRSIQYWVRDNFGYTVAAWIIALSLLFTIILLIRYLRQLAGQVPYWNLAWFLVLFLLVPLLLDRVEERLHFLTFGAFGALSLLLFSPRTAILLCLAFSAGDEVLQYYLPDRVGDIRDVAMNSLASLAAALFVWLNIHHHNEQTGNGLG